MRAILYGLLAGLLAAVGLYGGDPFLRSLAGALLVPALARLVFLAKEELFRYLTPPLLLVGATGLLLSGGNPVLVAAMATAAGEGLLGLYREARAREGREAGRLA